MMSRRDFIKLAGTATAAGALWGLEPGSALAGENAKSRCTLKPATRESFPMLEVSGSPGDVGYATGKAFASQIQEGFSNREKWFQRIKAYAHGNGKKIYDAMLGASKEHAPRVMEELQGRAEGSGVPFDDIFIVNCNCELEALLEGAACAPPGCSTVVLKEPSRLVLHTKRSCICSG